MIFLDCDLRSGVAATKIIKGKSSEKKEWKRFLVKFSLEVSCKKKKADKGVAGVVTTDTDYI